MTILIIDDDSSMIEMLLKTIDWEKLEVDTRLTASSAAAARQMIESQPVDLLLCDIEMPGGSGIELLQWMRDRGLETPNIFLTNHTRFDYAQTAIKLGAVDFVSKMSSAQELEDAIRRGSISSRHSVFRNGMLIMGVTGRRTVGCSGGSFGWI